MLAVAVALGCGAAHGVAAKATVSPCGTANTPTWSPDGTQIAWFGYRWPRPHGHGVGSYNILRAVCVSDANGKNLHQVPKTVCGEHCSPSAFGDPTGQIDWVAPSLLLAGNDLGVFRVSIGQKPKLLGHNGPEPYSTDAAGDRVATANIAFGCSGCSGPVTIRSVPSGAVVGTVGGTKHNNDQPSLSPDGTQVVFTRTSGKNAEAKPSIWTAAADGSHLHRLERSGLNPLWSPTGNRIAYRPRARLGRRGGSWRRRAARAPRSCATAPAPSSAGPERQVDRLPGLEGEARPHQRRDEEGADAAEASASVSGLQCRLVAEFAGATGALAAAVPHVLPERPVAGSDRRVQAAPRARLLTRAIPLGRAASDRTGQL